MGRPESGVTQLTRRELLRATAAAPMAALASQPLQGFQDHGGLDIGIFLKAPWQAVGMDGEPLTGVERVTDVEGFRLPVQCVEHRS